eukprot:4493721-Amphidinium_carterae.1
MDRWPKPHRGGTQTKSSYAGLWQSFSQASALVNSASMGITTLKKQHHYTTIVFGGIWNNSKHNNSMKI